MQSCSTGTVDLIVRPFQTQEQEQVKALILDGLRNHWGRIDPDKNPDSDNIEESYRENIFLVAWQKDELVGSGALIEGSALTAEIVRKSVAREWQKKE